MEPEPLRSPPALDPRAHAIESHLWDREAAFHLVSHEGRHYAWIAGLIDDSDQVFVMPDENAARAFLAERRAQALLGTEQGRRVAAVTVISPAGSHLMYEAAVLDGSDDGIWLAVYDATSKEGGYELAGFDDVGTAVGIFADRAEEAASNVEGRPAADYADILAAHLRYRAAMARAHAARAALGDTVRRNGAHLRAARTVRHVAQAVGVSREFLHRVLAKDEWVWKGTTGMERPAGSSEREMMSARADPQGGWAVTVKLAIDVPGEDQAMAITRNVLGEMDVALVAEPASAASDAGVPIVEAELDLSGLDTISPDTARSRIMYVIRNLDGITWRVIHSDEHYGQYEWPPGLGATSGRTEVFIHTAVRAVTISARAGQ